MQIQEISGIQNTYLLWQHGWSKIGYFVKLPVTTFRISDFLANNCYIDKPPALLQLHKAKPEVILFILMFIVTNADKMNRWSTAVPYLGLVMLLATPSLHQGWTIDQWTDGFADGMV